jgi:uncharacterized protein with NRDE domain
VCTLAVYFRVSDRLPLLVAANRDEFLDRPSTSPRLICKDPWVVAGQDLSAGGTWFGVNEDGMVVGLLNRRSSTPPDPARRSRGLLCLETLQTRSPGEALTYLRNQNGSDYNGFNMLVADTTNAFVASNPAPGGVAVTRLTAGVHLLTNLDLNDPTCPRIAGSHELFRDLPLPSSPDGAPELLAGLRHILSDHATTLDPRTTRPETVCVHLPGYGTRSSSIVARFATFPTVLYWHAQAPPCQALYEPVPLPSPSHPRSFKGGSRLF